MNLPDGPLTEAIICDQIRPLFSRVLLRDEIYLANHSLGRPLDQTASDVKEALDLWFERLDGCWDEGGWLDELDRFRRNVAALIGHPDSSCIVHKVSAGQGLRAVLNAMPNDRPLRVLATSGEFDSIDFILRVYASRGRIEVLWIEPSGEPPLFDSGSIIDALSGIDLVVLSMAMFGTGQILPNVAEIVAAAHREGAMVLLDAYHAAGVVPVNFAALGVDFMVGGSYKYTRGGPGACWLAIAPERIDMRTLDTGWFAKHDKFLYERPETPLYAPGGEAWMESTPAVLPLYQARAGLEFTLDVGVGRLRDHSLRQQRLLREAFASAGVPCYLPADEHRFGAFTLVPSNDPSDFCKSLKSMGVNVDSRAGYVRFGPDVLNSDAELLAAASLTARAMESAPLHRPG
jgi:kynureninase